MPVAADGLAATTWTVGNRPGVGTTRDRRSGQERPETDNTDNGVEGWRSDDLANLRRRRILGPTRVGRIEKIPATRGPRPTGSTDSGLSPARVMCRSSNMTISAWPVARFVPLLLNAVRGLARMVPLFWVSTGVPVLCASKSSARKIRPRQPTQGWHAVCHSAARTNFARASAHRTGYPIRRVFDRSMRQVRSTS